VRRFCQALLLSTACVAGCTIEQTPQSYIDHLATPAAEIEASRDELTDRVLSVGVALQREDSPAILAALVPHSEVYVYGPEHAQELTTPGGVVAELLEHARDVDVAMTVPTVDVGPSNDVAWFRTTFLINGGNTDAADVRFSGVFLRQEGEWRLVQAHISRVVPEPLTPLDSARLEGSGTPGGGG
jgi:hypothetical protein